jgi:hypothetical protein
VARGPPTRRIRSLLASVAWVLANETRSLIAGEAVAPIVMERLKEALGRVDCITDLENVATLHLGPGAILVALTLAFRRDSTTDMIEDAIREITHALQKADGRIAYVYVLRRIGLTNQVADASDVRFGSLAEIVSRPRHVRSSPQSRHSPARVARPQYAKSGHRRRYQTGMPGALTGAKGELSQHYRRAPRRESRFARGRS